MPTHNSNVEAAYLYPHFATLPSGIVVCPLPVLDGESVETFGLFARLDYDEAEAVAARSVHPELGPGRLISEATLHELGNVGLQLMPYLGTPIAETAVEHSRRHDEDVWRQLAARKWDGRQPVAGAGKHWLAGAPPGRSKLGGWDKDGPGPDKALWNPVMVAHNRRHFDDGTTTMVEWGVRRHAVMLPPSS